jgi:hypothetical protein
MTDELPVMVRTVEQYIQDKTGKRIKIIFNDPMNIRKHVVMLNEAYSISLVYYNNKDKQL